MNIKKKRKLLVKKNQEVEQCGWGESYRGEAVRIISCTKKI